jgi:hypothetical protein
MSVIDSKPFTKLFESSGLMSKHLEEFKRWRLVDENEEGAKDPEQTLEELVNDISILLENENILPQTRLSPLPVQAPKLWTSMDIEPSVSFYAIMDEIGNLIVPPQTSVYRGIRFTGEGSDGKPMTVVIEDVEVLFEGDRVVAYLVKIQSQALD